MSEGILKDVLHVGPGYMNHKGGMGAVLSVYNNNIENFKFISTYDYNKNKLSNIVLYFFSLIKLMSVLLNDKKLKIVHIHTASKGSFFRKYLVFLICRYIYKRKTILHLHGGEFHVFYKNGCRF